MVHWARLLCPLDQFLRSLRDIAACVLEVRAGIRTPDQATEELSISLPTYYNLEARPARAYLVVYACTSRENFVAGGQGSAGANETTSSNPKATRSSRPSHRAPTTKP